MRIDRRSVHMNKIDRLIINGPYEEPREYWHYNRERRAFSIKPGRRPAGYLKASEQSRFFDDPGIFVEIPRVNYIRDRVSSWRRAGYPGVTSMTKRFAGNIGPDPEREGIQRLFFCQLEAAETLIWLTEATAERNRRTRYPERWWRIPKAMLEDGHRPPARPS